MELSDIKKGKLYISDRDLPGANLWTELDCCILRAENDGTNRFTILKSPRRPQSVGRKNEEFPLHSIRPYITRPLKVKELLAE